MKPTSIARTSSPKPPWEKFYWEILHYKHVKRLGKIGRLLPSQMWKCVVAYTEQKRNVGEILAY
ncbi:hypothetical protein L7F22_040952, partial [Adiantum nelumboides]|nr:hypothetical protein [Adiantum nelumboides]